METTNTNISTKRFTINNFKQELKDLAKLQHDEKLFFKHPERYPNFIKDHEQDLIKEYQNFHKGDSAEKMIPWRLGNSLKDNLSYQARESQTQCNERRMHLASLYNDYYALKHWKKLDMEDDKSMFKYFYRDYLAENGQQKLGVIIDKKMKDLYERKYIDNSPEGQKFYDELKKMYHDKLLTTSEYYDRIDKLKRISWFEYKRNALINYTDKED